MTYSMMGLGAWSEDPLRGCGTTASDVKMTQKTLNKLGYTDQKGLKLVEDGKFGPATAFALAKYMTAAAARGRPDGCRALLEDGVSSAQFPAKSQPATMPATPKVSVTVQTPKPGAPAVVTAKVEPTPLPLPGAPASKPSEPAVEEKSVMGGLDKNAMIFGAVALGALALGALLLRKPSATPNRATGRFAGLPPVGRTMEVGESGKKRRIGHGTPPKKYREMGATKPSDYAWPEGFMYPIHDAKHVRAAASRFGKYKASYPLKMRQTIAKRLNAAKKKFGVGGKPATPNRSR